jgi:hypothetical protein
MPPALFCQGSGDCFFETGSSFVAQAGLELAVLLQPPNAGVTDMPNHTCSDRVFE